MIIDLTPEPAMPLPAPGVTLVLPLMHPMTAGDRLDLFRVDPATGQYVSELDVNGAPVMGTVDVDGVTATFHNVMHLSTVVGMVPATIGVAIDIKPGEDPATIQTNSQGKIPVAILSSPTFNVPAMVNPATLTFGRTGDEHSLAFCGVADVNGDGLPDLVCHFDTQAAGFQAGEEVGVLKGKTVTNVQRVWIGCWCGEWIWL